MKCLGYTKIKLLLYSLFNKHKEVKFSIIMPTYNRKDMIDKAISSILNQTLQNFELIIVDDGSTDNTKEYICRKYA